MTIDNNSRRSDDDKKSFSLWQAKAIKAENEELLEKRKAELNRLVRKVINSELSEYDKRLVELHWYKGLSKAEIAQLMNVDRSTIHRHFCTINETVYEKLRYAVELIYGKNSDTETKKFINETGKTYSSHINSDDISRRTPAFN